MTDVLGTILVLSMLAFMAARAVPPMGANLKGKVQLQVPLPVVFRVLDQRINVMAILAVLILGSGLIGERWISHELFLLAIIATVGIVLFPKRYRFTDEGVSPNRATFRTWSEFQGWRHSGNVIRLEGTERFSSLNLYVAASDSNAVKQLLGRHLPRLVTARAGVRDAHGDRSTHRFARARGGTK
ncbi:MAG TPA: hypothetical protein VF937_02045 [Chloroflexota bacterium]